MSSRWSRLLEVGASSRARVADPVTVSRACALSARVRDESRDGVCAEASAGAPMASATNVERRSAEERGAAESSEVRFMLTPYAGASRIRFDGCDLSVAQWDAPRSS